ncbi:uncharacterized protein BKA78DRAFT_177207 [Phyllosticta capitalensis]|uniref:uncharacterized protein n=1 Tax=Phyllosticta capitalensis TaxID=121624 RepID=UPI003131CB72
MLLGWWLEVEIAAEKFSGPARSRGKGAAVWPSSIVRSPRSGLVGWMDNFKRSACGDGLLRFTARSNFERCASRKLDWDFPPYIKKGALCDGDDRAHSNSSGDDIKWQSFLRLSFVLLNVLFAILPCGRSILSWISRLTVWTFHGAFDDSRACHAGGCHVFRAILPPVLAF